MDDVLSLAKTQHIRTPFDTIKNITDGITFTIEKEKDREIAFLDVLLTRTDKGTIETQVYRKKTHTAQDKLHKNSIQPCRNTL